MRQIVRYRFMTIPNKLVGEMRITVDERSAEYTANFDGGKATNISLFPVINLQMLQPADTSDSLSVYGKTGWDMNASIGLTKFTFPIFLEELKAINRGLRKPDLYVYHGTRLELNSREAEKARRVFMIGNTTVEFSPVVIDTAENKLEGVKIKFNNEKASILLTVNELNVLLYNLTALNIDLLAFTMYLNYVTKGDNYHMAKPRRLVDIAPKMDFDSYDVVTSSSSSDISQKPEVKAKSVDIMPEPIINSIVPNAPEEIPFEEEKKESDKTIAVDAEESEGFQDRTKEFDNL